MEAAMTDRMRVCGDKKYFNCRKWLVMSFVMTLVLSPVLLYADECPQPRNTKRAPASYYQKENPLPPDPENILAGKILFEQKAKPLPCMQCHGLEGTGNGPMAFGLNPPPRNFTCAQTIKGVPDGQLFWIIRNGSKGTGMPAFKKLEDEQIWQLILYIRKLSLTRMVERAISPNSQISLR
jgi:mono/diheme cytochrome c family protein